MAEGWKLYIADAFAEELYGGNQAGIVLLDEAEDFPQESVMCKIAGELKHSETAFVKRRSKDAFHIRYFTPAGEVELCGHATIGAFEVMKAEGIIQPGAFQLKTRAAELTIDVEPEGVWMDLAAPKEWHTFSWEEAKQLYQAYGLDAARCSEQELLPKIVSAGLKDILLPVANTELLQQAKQQEAQVCALSEQYQVVGVHMFCLSRRPGILAECRNFAPRYEISEEAATGTSNGALTWYLYCSGLLAPGEEAVFLQGEAMGRPAKIRSRLEISQAEHACSLAKDGHSQHERREPRIRIGGGARISLKGVLPYGT